jgi:hypothetical protein
MLGFTQDGRRLSLLNGDGVSMHMMSISLHRGRVGSKDNAENHRQHLKWYDADARLS